MTETDPLAGARAIMKQQAADAGQRIIERWHSHPSNGPCGPGCLAGGTDWDGRGLVIDHFKPAGARTFYMIACLECGDPDRPRPMPFGDQAERGKWASAHTRGTGHDTWRVWEEAK